MGRRVLVTLPGFGAFSKQERVRPWADPPEETIRTHGNNMGKTTELPVCPQCGAPEAGTHKADCPVRLHIATERIGEHLFWQGKTLTRIAAALERIADNLEPSEPETISAQPWCPACGFYEGEHPETCPTQREARKLADAVALVQTAAHPAWGST